MLAGLGAVGQEIIDFVPLRCTMRPRQHNAAGRLDGNASLTVGAAHVAASRNLCTNQVLAPTLPNNWKRTGFGRSSGVGDPGLAVLIPERPGSSRGGGVGSGRTGCLWSGPGSLSFCGAVGVPSFCMFVVIRLWTVSGSVLLTWCHGTLVSGRPQVQHKCTFSEHAVC